MSVLNQMLRELEQRGAMPAIVAAAGTATVARPTLPPAPRPADPVRRWVWAALVCVAAGLAGTYAWLARSASSASVAPAPLGARQFGAIAGVGTGGPSSAMPAPAAPLAPRPRAGDEASISASIDALVATPNTAPGTTPVTAPVDAAVGTSARTVVGATLAPPQPAAPATAEPNRAASVSALRNSDRRAWVAPVPQHPAQESSAAASATRPQSAATGALAAAPARSSTTTTAAASQPEPAHPAPAVVARVADDIGRELDRADDLIARGRASEAIELLQHALARQPAHTRARRTLAALLAEAGRRSDALAVLLAGAQADPVRLAPAAAQLQAELGDLQGALATVSRIPSAQRLAAHEALAAGLLQRAGDHAGAIAAYRRALTQPKPEPIWWVGLAVSLEASGELTDAHAAFAHAAADPRLPGDVRQYVQQRLAALPAHATSSEAARRPSLANVF